MTCYFCGGKVVRKKVDHIHKWGDKIYLFKGVAAEVCSQCGETYFDSVELQKMDQVIASDRKPTKKLTIPVFAL
ncbi:MAG: YgiT-type zinc finger protein [Nitrospirae bacterium]|nr:YgiT-type zinc finger protein [Nitrospirota bacterium]